MVCLKDKLQYVAQLLHYVRSLIPGTPELSELYSYCSLTIRLLVRHEKSPKTAAPD